MAECKTCINGVCQCDKEDDFLTGTACNLENKEDCEACQ